MVKQMSLKKNLDVTIYEKLFEEILQGNWMPGQTLNLDELAECYGVSRTPVQQALKRMHAQGMINFSNKGHFSVPVFNEKDVADLIEVRLLIEHQALSDIENKGICVDFSILEKISEECVHSNQTNDVVRTRRTDLDFHRELVTWAQNRYLSEVYMRVQGQFVVANYLLTNHTRVQQEIASDDHEKILQLMKKKDYAKAQEMIESHIQGAYRTIIMKMKS